jgi:Domain of unknown function (DUF4177)
VNQPTTSIFIVAESFTLQRKGRDMSETKRTISVVFQGLALLTLLALVTLQLITRTDHATEAARLRVLLLEPRYEYKVVVFAGSASDRTGADALEAASIEVDEKELSRLGSQGWEIVDSFLEMETAYPNFGNDKYVTGLQTNVRPQRLVMVLRHRIG